MDSNNHLFDVSYTNDNSNRLTEAKEAHWGGSSISGPTRDEQWTSINQAGDLVRVELDAAILGSSAPSGPR